MRDSVEHQLIALVRRRWLDTIAVIYLLALLWIGSVPFDFSADSLHSLSGGWMGLAVAPFHWTDIVANIILFVPVGLLARGIWRRHVSRRHGDLAAAVLIGVAISYATEYLHRWSPSRVSSVADFVCNMLGTAIGAFGYSFVTIAGAAYASHWRTARQRVVSDVLERPSIVLAKIVALMIAFAALAPFDVSVSVNRLAESFQSTHWQPLDRVAQLSPLVYEQKSSPIPLVQRGVEVRRQRDRMQLYLDYVRLTAAYALLGALIGHYLRRHCGMSSVRSVGYCVWSAGMLAIGCFAGQWLIMSRSSDTTEIILALCGAALGAVSVQSWVGASTVTGESVFRRLEYRRLQKGLCWSLAACVVFAIAREFAPLIRRDGSGLSAAFASIEWLPFLGYQRAKLPIALHDLLGKFALYAVIAGLWTVQRRVGGPNRKPVGTIQAAGAVMLAVAFLEAGQLLIASRTCSITDVIIAGVASAVGVLTVRVSAAQVSIWRAEQFVHVERVMYNVEFGGKAPSEKMPKSPSETR